MSSRVLISLVGREFLEPHMSWGLNADPSSHVAPQKTSDLVTVGLVNQATPCSWEDDSTHYSEEPCPAGPGDASPVLAKHVEEEAQHLLGRLECQGQTGTTPGLSICVGLGGDSPSKTEH